MKTSTTILPNVVWKRVADVMFSLEHGNVKDMLSHVNLAAEMDFMMIMVS